MIVYTGETLTIIVRVIESPGWSVRFSKSTVVQSHEWASLRMRTGLPVVFSTRIRWVKVGVFEAKTAPKLMVSPRDFRPLSEVHPAKFAAESDSKTKVTK